MQTEQATSSNDTCKVLAYSSSTDAYGNPSPTYTAGSAIACGVKYIKPGEVQGTGEVPVIHARVRLPLDTTITEEDRVQVTKRYGTAITAQTFDVVGPVERGPSALVVNLRLADDA